jgi:hypothetical protein
MRMPMHMELNETCGEMHAISDVFCEKRRRFLVSYPTPLIIMLAGAGLLAFIFVGYLGYNTRLDCGGHGSCWTLTTFRQPWPLYVWFSALMVVLQVSILRHPRLRAQLVATLVVTLVSTVLMGWLFFYSGLDLQSVIIDILHLRLGFSRYLLSRQWTYTIINFLVIIVFFTDTTVRWVRRAQGISPTESLSAGDTKAAGPNDPRVEELAAGDLVAGLVLFGLMAVVFTYDFIHGTAALTGLPQEPKNPIFTNIADVPAGVPLLGGVHLSLIDRLLALVCLPVGFVVLAIAATLSGLSAVRAVYQYPARTIAGMPASDNSATAQVALVLYNAVTAAVDRYVRLIVYRIIRSFRNVLWVILTFLASLGLALLAKQVQTYLHTSPRPVDVLLYAAFGAAVAVLSVVMAQSLQLFSPRVATNALQLLGWVGFVLALTFWLFSGTMVGLDWLGQVAGVVPPALSDVPVLTGAGIPPGSTCPPGQNYFLNLFNPTHVGCNQPFAASYLTFASAALLVIILGWLFTRRSIATARK